MPDKPVLHGHDHRPGGFDPTEVGPWHNIGDPGEPAFINGSNMAPTATVPNPVPLRFRLATGAPNMIDLQGNLLNYTDHQIEIQGDVTDVSPGDLVFVLPIEYRHDHDVPCHAHDDTGAYVACRLLSSGEFYYGVA